MSCPIMTQYEGPDYGEPCPCGRADASTSVQIGYRAYERCCESCACEAADGEWGNEVSQ